MWIVLFIAAAAQGVFLSLMLLFRNAKKKSRAQNLLGALILTFTITIAYYTTFWMGINPSLPGALRIILSFTYIFGPLAWMFLHQTVYNRLPKKAWLHYLPFVLMSILSFLASRLPAQVRFSFGVIQIAHLIIYSLLNLRLVHKTEQNQWIRNVAVSFAGYTLCFLIYDVLNWTGVLRTQHDYMVSFGMTIFIYFIGYLGFKTPTFSNGNSDEKYQKSSLTDNSIQYIARKLDELMTQEKLYTKGDLKLQEVAEALDLGVHALSQAVNVSKGKKFTDYLNELRVEEAIRLMQQEEYQDMKLLAIAIDAGFNNKTSFLNAFRKHTGQTPSEYRKGVAA